MKIEDQPDNIYYENEQHFRDCDKSLFNPNLQEEYSPRDLAQLLEAGGSIHGLYILSEIPDIGMTSPAIWADIENTAVDNIYEQEHLAAIHIALHGLTEGQYNAVIEYFYHGKTLQEIALEKGTSKQAIHEGLQLGIENIQDLVQTFISEHDETEKETHDKPKNSYFIGKYDLEAVVSTLPPEEQTVINKRLSTTTSDERISKDLGMDVTDFRQITARGRVLIWEQFGRFNKDYSTWRLKTFHDIIPSTVIETYQSFKKDLDYSKDSVQAFEVFMGVNSHPVFSVDATALELGIEDREEVRRQIEDVLIEIEEVKSEYLRSIGRNI